MRQMRLTIVLCVDSAWCDDTSQCKHSWSVYRWQTRWGWCRMHSAPGYIIAFILSSSLLSSSSLWLSDICSKALYRKRYRLWTTFSVSVWQAVFSSGCSMCDHTTANRLTLRMALFEDRCSLPWHYGSVLYLLVQIFTMHLNWQWENA